MNPIKKILIAEDELIVARVMKRVLEQNGYEVMQVCDEAHAIQASAEFRPDLLILDIHLKNKSSGLLAGKEIRKQGMQCPILFTTGNSYEQTREAIKEIVNCHLFIKPIDTEQIVQFLDTNFGSINV
jgi:DNA-binding response OmpR family regulator